ncbi:hypothetical protein [Bacillus sp. MMSF_3328]|uniref:hypothetical protein n=1 Tax=Bacillus sp. MMSF_3328 TaxID=3047080 RepID=UPI00273F205F|nr:hypothetical protein [Bacillus sp. MMSF_3328]
MKITNTIPFFLETGHLSADFFREYHRQYPDIFAQYFQYHCRNHEKRIPKSIEQLESEKTHIQRVQENILPIIHETAARFKAAYGVEFPIEVSLIAGIYGSNAYTWRQIIPNITFALEQLTDDKEHLRAIVSHEFGHAAQNILSDQAGMDWKSVSWNNPLIWLNQEGAAIHFSRKIAPGLASSAYFSFNDQGDAWLSFAKSHTNEIIRKFYGDFKKLQHEEIFREWFSIRGGQSFGFSRFGYYVGDLFFQSQIQRLGEEKAIIAWCKTDFLEQVQIWLESKKSLSS